MICFPHRLDAYQAESIKCVENSRNLFLSAHTSAGKTAVAKYLTYHVRSARIRMLYVTPYEKLALRKYRELADEVDSVAYLAGDMDSTVGAEEPSCLVMTVQVLLARVYRDGGWETMGSFDWIVFDDAQALGYPGWSIWGGVTGLGF